MALQLQLQVCCAGLCFAACEGYDVMLMTPHRHRDGWSNKVDCQQEKARGGGRRKLGG
jgi:hypothetical protein